MSSSTEFHFIFPESTTLIVTVGNGIVPEYMGIPANQETHLTGETAFNFMQNSNIVGVMNRFDQSLLNLLIDRHEQNEEEESALRQAHMQKHTKNFGVYLLIKHHR
ncbi:hypothetical protein pEaSNUABM14_00269 [Erwinia phage pEa_SNUABM_14]|uniref:Uncharacterized protein n=1 Tax=Erwinia phage pEa_SNUABM_7 TaxID=2866695 RepID=A0AAE7WSI1_9CAUD|nr:hypothetical protein MPK74_gp270 [Erwinia phage pEa_SNUABM_7]QYW03569.1 hypothetical protein pEaSNUABM34_00267 [Erwinia phage pEa_SNUABM_34]QYW03910.1 hypothetical protein pEaSNUABM45_00267 [Erwinia phage pEa_SNUABM_45]QYW04251.1 hypothetical protein pEaSNUABM46_00267 [Erwinia phage pEa_SNUABM_46]QYW04594.1 hypothetical protein pEaSNUABM14_00269 [Erwinia phage pEa_SNUABM_14]QYW05281.1 hypothetical protein pEaSNUABM21_00267 [Erwinia phage pEa_SNUABM_21]QYW05622.1 hypothetical protein pEaSNU